MLLESLYLMCGIFELLSVYETALFQGFLKRPLKYETSCLNIGDLVCNSTLKKKKEWPGARYGLQ